MSVKVRLQDARGVLMAKLTPGLVTRGVMERVMGETANRLGGQSPAVFVADFRSGAWALGVEDLDRPLRNARPELVAPAALIVSPAAYDLFKAHAWNMAEQGILRRVFTDPDAAASWARLRLPAGLQK